MALESGSRVGNYEITAPLVGFGIGEAYSADDIRLGREVAVKVYRVAPDSDELRRLEEKMSRAITLYHANIGTILEFDVGGDFPYAVMEIFDGESLRARLARGRLPWRECVMIGSDVALGLAAAHEKGIVHGNLVPGSIFLGSDGRVRILDFGSGGALSSLDGPRDAEADLAALGRALHEAATGEPIRVPIEALDENDLREALAEAGTPEGFSTTVARYVARKPEERHQTARELALELRSLLTESGALIPTVPTKQSQPAWVAGAVLLILFVLLAFLLVSQEGAPVHENAPTTAEEPAP